MVRQSNSKILAIFMAFILILNTLTPMTSVFAEGTETEYNKDGIKDAELFDERDKEEDEPKKYTGEIESISEGAEENTIIFDLSDEYETKDSFLGFEHRLYIDSDKDVTILNKEDRVIDLKDGYTEYIEEANKQYNIKLKKDNKETIEYTVLVKTADYVEEPELVNIEKIKNETFNYGTTKNDLLEKLPKELTLNLSNSKTEKVAVDWALTKFVVDQAGEFKIQGKYDLPENIKGEKIPVELKVIILEESLETAELEKLIKAANEKTAKDYTTESFKNLETAIKAAEEALDSNDKNLIAEAATNLQTAIDQLVINNENYEFNEGTGTITKYKGTKENVIIPEEINGVKVKAIGNLAFGEKNLAGKKLNKVTLPNTVEKIEERAFYRAHLTEIVLSNNLTEVGIEAFKHNEIEKLVIPESARTIKKGAFASNILKKVTLPNELTTIEINTFKDNNLTEVILPGELTKIGTGAFASNEIKKLDIPAKLTEVTGFANNELTELTIPNTVIKIGKAAFPSNNLKSVEIPNSVTDIGEQAFSDMNLEKLTVGDSVEEIGKKAFYGNKIKKVELSKSTTVIKEKAFADNRLPNGSVKISNKKSEVRIGNDAFNPTTAIFLEDVEENLGFELFDIISTSDKDILISGEQQENVIEFNEKLKEASQNLIDEGDTSFHIKVESGNTLSINNKTQEENDVYYKLDRSEDITFTLEKHGVEKEFQVNLEGIFIEKNSLKEQLIKSNKVIESSLLTDDSEMNIIKITKQAQAVYDEKTSTQAEVDQITTVLEDELKKKQFILEVNLNGEIIKYNGTKEELIIPSTWNETTIKQINANVFANSNLKKVSIPETIEVIEKNAFANNALEEVKFEVNKLINIMQRYNYLNLNTFNELIIKTDAFKNNKLTEVYLPYQVTELENLAFSENKFKLFSVKIDNYKSRVSLGENVFDDISPTFLRTHINEVDKTYLAELIDQFKTNKVEEYTEETYDKYQKAYDKALVIFEENSSEEEVAQSINELIQTKNQLKIDKELTKEDLKELLALMKNIDTQDYNGDIDAMWKIIRSIESNIEEDLEQEDIEKLYEGLNDYYQEFSTPEELFGYKILNDHEVAITEYRGVSSSLIIPTEIDGRKVTQIADKALSNKSLSTITLPETIYKLGNQAFADNNLESIQLPESLKQLGTEVFKDNSLTEVAIPGRVEVIPNATFSGNNTLEEVHLSEGLKEINRLAFAQSKIHTVEFPTSLEKIGDLAFASNKITEVRLKENVVEIGKSAFQDNKIEEGNATINNIEKNVNEEVNAFANNGTDSIEQIKLIYNETEETAIEVDSIENIEVEFNTELSVIEEKLPKEIELKINQLLQPGKVNTETVDINWDLKTYDQKEIGTYKFVGMYELPEGITAKKPEITVEVTVLAEKTDISELEAAIKHAEKVNNDPNATVEEVEEAINNLNEKLKLFKPDNDLSALEAAIELAKNTDTSGKSEESVKKLKQTIQDSEKTLKNEYITQPKIDQAILDLQAAIDGLEDKPVDFSKLEAAIEAAKETDTSNKTNESIAKLEQAVEDSEVVLNDGDSTQTEVDATVEALEKAIAGLTEIPVDFSKLKKAIEAGNKADITNKTEDSLATLDNAIANAEEVLANEDVKQADVDQAVEDLEAAIAGLKNQSIEDKVDTSVLASVLEKAKKASIANKTATSIQALDEATQKAEAILENDASTQTEIDEVVKDLQAAIQGLVDKPAGETVDKSELDKVVDQVKEIDTTGKTKNTVKKLNEAIKQAEAVLKDDSITQAEIDEAIEALNAVIKGLTDIKAPEKYSSNGSGGEVLPNDLDNDSTKDGISDKKETGMTSKEKAESKKDENLPSTASNIFNLFALGLILIALGVLLIRRKKVN